jgi:hypothetical protein
VLPNNSTIETVWFKLTHQREYIAGVVDKMRLCMRNHQNASVAIGITGSGQKPYYRITYKAHGTGTTTIFGSFYDNHEPLESAFATSSNWSTETMNYGELLAFFRIKTGYAGPDPKI